MTLYNEYRSAAELVIQTLVTSPTHLPSDLPDLICEGPFLKRGRRHSSSWKERWFCLFSNYQLLYYLDQHESNKATNLCGWIDLHDVWMINALSTEASITQLIPSFMKPSYAPVSRRPKMNKRKSLRLQPHPPKLQINGEHRLCFITSTQTIYLKTYNSNSYLQWILLFNTFVFDNKAKIIYQGWLFKKSERKRRHWNRRWVIMEDYTKALTYYADPTRSSFKHFIALHDIVDDITINKTHKSYPYCFTISTLQRHYTFATKQKNVMHKWIRFIQKGRMEVLAEIEQEQQHVQGEKSVSSMNSNSDTDSDCDHDVSVSKNPLHVSMEEKIQHTTSTAEKTFIFEPKALEWLQQHDMMHTGHLSARKLRALDGEELPNWRPSIHDNAVAQRPWSPWSNATHITTTSDLSHMSLSSKRDKSGSVMRTKNNKKTKMNSSNFVIKPSKKSVKQRLHPKDINGHKSRQRSSAIGHVHATKHIYNIRPKIKSHKRNTNTLGVTVTKQSVKRERKQVHKVHNNIKEQRKHTKHQLTCTVPPFNGTTAEHRTKQYHTKVDSPVPSQNQSKVVYTTPRSHRLRKASSNRKRSTQHNEEICTKQHLKPWLCGYCHFMNRSVFINDPKLEKWTNYCLLCGRKKQSLIACNFKGKIYRKTSGKLLKEWRWININECNFSSERVCNSHHMDCVNVKRLIFTMKYFDKLTKRTRKYSTYADDEMSMRDFFEYIADYDIGDVYSDFYHCLQFHWNKFLIYLFSANIQNTECDQSECIHFKRNYRDRSKCINNKYRYSLYVTNDNNEIAVIQILDSIHCMMVHDLSMEIMNEYQTQEGDDEFKLNVMKRRRSLLTRHHVNKLLMDECDIQKISKRIYQGNEGKYKWAKRTSIDYLYLKPHHPNIFTETTCNPIYSLSIEQWKTQLHKAELYSSIHRILNPMNSTASKQHLNEWGLSYTQPIRIEHILCIMMYCNHAEYAVSFRKIHRKLQKHDTKQIVYKRHARIFYWFGRFLMEAVQFYGNAMDDKVMLYHPSMNAMLFHSFDAPYKYPTLTTSSALIAQTFIGSNGMILELSAKFYGYLNQTRYLDVRLISDFKDECECLCIAHDTDYMLIHDIITVHTLYIATRVQRTIVRQYRKWIKCLHIFEQICSGNDTRNFYYTEINEDSINLIQMLLENEMNINMNNEYQLNGNIPQVIQSLFHYYCITKKGESPYAKYDERKKYIDIGNVMDEWFNLYQEYFDSKEKILRVFPNIKQFRVMDIRGATATDTPQFAYLSAKKYKNRGHSNNSSLYNVINADNSKQKR